MPPLVTLTTDFGTRDYYVASMKGVLHALCPGVQVTDLTHEIAPQCVFEAAYFLAAAAPYFPDGTVHCIVVDPGVGTERLPIVVQAGDQFYVCPDNGLLTFLAKHAEVQEARIITNRRFMLSPISATFHGRDIFAPAAAALARGVPLRDAGDTLSTLTMLDIPQVRSEANGTHTGVVMHVDRFGNLITNIHRETIGTRPIREVQIGEEIISSIHETYGDVAPGMALALFGSLDYLEVAVHRGSAADRMRMGRGMRVEVRL